MGEIHKLASTGNSKSSGNHQLIKDAYKVKHQSECLNFQSLISKDRVCLSLQLLA